MTEFFIFYFCAVLDDIKSLSIIFVVLLGLLAFIFILNRFFEGEEGIEYFLNLPKAKTFIGVWVVLLFLAICIPSKDVFYKSIALDFIKDDTIPPKAKKILEKLDKELDKLEYGGK